MFYVFISICSSLLVFYSFCAIICLCPKPINPSCPSPKVQAYCCPNPTAKPDSQACSIWPNTQQLVSPTNRPTVPSPTPTYLCPITLASLHSDLSHHQLTPAGLAHTAPANPYEPPFVSLLEPCTQWLLQSPGLPLPTLPPSHKSPQVSSPNPSQSPSATTPTTSTHVKTHHKNPLQKGIWEMKEGLAILTPKNPEELSTSGQMTNPNPSLIFRPKNQTCQQTQNPLPTVHQWQSSILAPPTNTKHQKNLRRPTTFFLSWGLEGVLGVEISRGVSLREELRHAKKPGGLEQWRSGFLWFLSCGFKPRSKAFEADSWEINLVFVFRSLRRGVLDILVWFWKFSGDHWRWRSMTADRADGDRILEIPESVWIF